MLREFDDRQSGNGSSTDTVSTMSLLILSLFTLLGFFLLIAGVRLIALIAAFTGGVIGWCLGGYVHDTLIPEWSAALCAATASVAFAALAALFIRPAVAVGFGIAGTIAGLLFGGLLVERAIAPTAPLPTTSTSAQIASTENQPAASVRAARSGLTESIVSILGETHANADKSDKLTLLAGAGSRVLSQLKDRWSLVPGPTQTFLLAVTAAGAAMGLGLGVLFSRWALAGASAALGSLLFLGCGMPLAETIFANFRCPNSPAAWLFLGGATTLAGWAFQMRRVQTRKEAPQSA